MFVGGGFGVGLTVAALDLPRALSPRERPARLSEVLPVEARTAEEKALELRRVQQLKARLAAYEVDLVAGLAADRPDTVDRRPGQTGAAAGHDVPGPGVPDGVSEFFADELALILNCSRAEASVRADHAATLTERLPSTRAALADGALDWPRARAIAAELGWPARDTDPAVIAAVEEAVLPVAAELSVRRLKELVRRELTARDAEAAERRRQDAERGSNVTARPVGNGMGELVARMPWPLAAACRGQVDAIARAAKAAGDPRPIGVLRVAALADLVERPWADRESVAAQVTVVAPLDALSPPQFLADGSPTPAAFSRPGSLPAPTGEVNGAPITAAHLRELLAQLDAVCPGGLQAAAGGSLHIALTDPDGTLRAVVDRRQLTRLARRGCPDHPADPAGADTGCRCPVLDAPPPTEAYAPTAAQRVYVQTRDRTCRHPGCANRAGWADLDHVVPHACGGETACENLCCLCRRHHRLKTHARGWRCVMTADGVLSVTTPSGVTRVSRPPGQLDARGRRSGSGSRGSPGRRPAAAAGRSSDLPVTGPRLLVRRPDPPPPAPARVEHPPPSPPEDCPF